MGASLHLIKPFGFKMTDKRLRRAGLDYKELAQVFEYENFDHYLDKRCCRCRSNNAGLMLVDLGVESEKR
jgi:tRNA(Leu) C34 or U34 (ribose-2'-O)-methylase TrmL